MSENHHHHKTNKHHHHDEHDHHGHGHHEHGHDHGDMLQDFKKRFWVSLVLTLPIMVLAPMLQDLLGYEWRFNGDRYVQFALSSIVFFYGGWPFLKGLVDELKQRKPGMMTLIGLAIIVAYGYSSAVVFGLEGKIFFWELASLVAIMLLGHWIEMKSVMKASNALEELAKLMPDEALRVNDDDTTETVKTSELQVGDLILVKPGEKIPADGKISEGESHINEAMLTGESKPVAKKKGDKVIGGSINTDGTLKVKIEQRSEDSYLSKVINMVDEAQQSKSKTQNLANKAAAWLFYVALGSGILTIIAWLSLGHPFAYSLERMVTVMIISCPHALGLAIPLVVAISTSLSAQNGLLIRNRTAFENARKLTAVIFDKTGTLTKGNFAVHRYTSVSENHSDEDILQLAASVEQHSEHPIAGGILAKAKEEGLEMKKVGDTKNLTGKGIVADYDNKELGVVSPGYLKEKKLDVPEEAFEREAETVVFVVLDGALLGYVALADEIREDAFDAIKTLKEKGIKVIMATGDNEQVAKAVGDELELDEVYAEVLPEDKQALIKRLQDEGEFVAMTGDGVNDAPALAQADIGIAVGSGTDVAAETADIILVNSKPKDITGLILFGEATYRKMMQNLWWAAGYNIVAIPLAAGVLSGVGILLSPAVGAVLMSLSTVIVAVNAQLLRKKVSKD